MYGADLKVVKFCICCTLFCVPTAHGQMWVNWHEEARTRLATNWFHSGDSAKRLYKIEFVSYMHTPSEGGRRGYMLDFSVSDADAIPGLDTGFFEGPGAPGLQHKLLQLKAISTNNKDVSVVLAPAGSYNADLEGAFRFSASDGADEPIERILRCIAEGYEKLSVSVLSPDKTQTKPLVSVSVEAKYMRQAVEEFLKISPASP